VIVFSTLHSLLVSKTTTTTHNKGISMRNVVPSGRKRRSAKAPQLLGELTIDQAFLEALIQWFEQSDEDTIKLSLSAWRKDAKATGKIYLTVKAQIPPCIDTCEDETDLHLSGRMLLQDL